MTRISPVRRGALLLATLATGLGGTAATAAPGAAVAPTRQEAAQETAQQAAAQRTVLTFEVDGCARCQVRLYRAVEGRRHVWESRSRRVRDGKVTFDVPTRRTHGMSASVRAPWEGNTGFVTQVAVRYAHEQVGTTVPNRVAQHKHRASGCWAGTGDSAITVPLTVRKATIPGVDGSPTTAARAWISTTADWWQPMLHAYRGILGAQDVLFCKRP